MSGVALVGYSGSLVKQHVETFVPPALRSLAARSAPSSANVSAEENMGSVLVGQYMFPTMLDVAYPVQASSSYCSLRSCKPFCTRPRLSYSALPLVLQRSLLLKVCCISVKDVSCRLTSFLSRRIEKIMGEFLYYQGYLGLQHYDQSLHLIALSAFGHISSFISSYLCPLANITSGQVVTPSLLSSQLATKGCSEPSRS